MSAHRPQFGLVLANRGVVLGTTSVQALLTLACQAEETGWDSVWVGDSLLAKPRLDAIVLLSALAVQTHRVKLGPASFTSTPLRHALQLALQWCSLDVLSQGRMIFNASQGAPGPAGGAFVEEYAAFQVEPASRMRRMETAKEPFANANATSISITSKTFLALRWKCWPPLVPPSNASSAYESFSKQASPSLSCA
jgi:hypothetical protein